MPSSLRAERFEKVFVRAPNWLGDVVMATPHFDRIRRAFPDAQIVLGVKGGHGKVLDGLDSFDRRIAVSKPRGLSGLRAEARKLRSEQFDLAILFPNSVSSALVAKMAGIRRRLGYTQGRRLWITDGIAFAGARKPFWKRRGPRRVPVPMVDYWNDLLDAFDFPPADPHPRLVVTSGEVEACDRILSELDIDDGHRLVLFAPTAGFGPSKHWDDPRWATLARDLVALDPSVRVLLLCGPGEETLVRDIEQQAGRPEVRAALPPVPLDVTKPLVRAAALMVTLDSGPRHLAVAFDVPHVVLMGPTHPDYTSSNLEHGIILRHDVDCGPCHLPVCPLDHRCMRRITEGEVLEACRVQLGLAGDPVRLSSSPDAP
ncbi:MAG: glycosyltransferase family 9 protein [Planctomycetes bacterium]|nr:glycosyltransferase family 9 protein [Planctomycetota bacterium]